jgi:mannitol-1-phosphate/altronate dehydrogenase
MASPCYCGRSAAYDNVGALFTDDISLCKQMKLRLFNAGHSIISVLGSLKIQQRWFQGINNALTRNVSTALMSYIVAAG